MMLHRDKFCSALMYHNFNEIALLLYLPHRQGSYLDNGILSMLKIKGVMNITYHKKRF